MCGGWRFANSDYKPTPQPKDFVRVVVCKVCGKRGKHRREVIHSKEVSKYIPRLIMRDKGNEFAYYSYYRRKRVTETKVEVGSCCHRTKNHIKVVGQVIRTVWSKDRDRAPNKFFFVVEVPRLGKKVWIKLDAHIELVAATDYLIANVGFIT